MVQLIIITIACLVAIACALPGIFLVLRGLALMSDAISHAILLGIALTFLYVQQLQSPLLLCGAAAAGLLTVVCTEWLIATRYLKKDAAIGIVFPLFFSLGIIIISRYAHNVHLDTDMILLGEIAFAPFNRCIIKGIDYGPYALWLLSFAVLINAFFIIIFYKELKMTIFDHDIAQLAGFSPSTIFYLLMTLTSFTAVAAFDCVGSIVVVALMIVPAATAYLLTNELVIMIILSLIIGIVGAIAGCLMAAYYDVSIAGSIATMTGFIFLIMLILAPEKGMLAHANKRVKILYD